MWTIFKVFLDLLQYCFCFIFWHFGHEACRILSPRPGIETAPHALESKVLTTVMPGKSLTIFYVFLFANTWAIFQVMLLVLEGTSEIGVGWNSWGSKDQGSWRRVFFLFLHRMIAWDSTQLNLIDVENAWNMVPGKEMQRTVYLRKGNRLVLLMCKLQKAKANWLK